MIKLGIIGHPLTHTLSPPMQQAALQALGLEGFYKTFDIESNMLPTLLQTLQQEGYNGVNVTIPYKVKIMDYINEISPTAQTIGAVNTLVFKNNIIYGDNTDVHGFMQSLILAGYKDFQKTTACIMGCGGSALAVIAGLFNLNINHFEIYVRNLSKAQSLFQQIQNYYPEAQFTLQEIHHIQLTPQTSILINCTPCGMYPDNHAIPLDPSVLKQAPSGMILYDLIYKPQETKLIQAAQALNIPTINGIDMLVHQGAKALALWTGHDNIPYEVMKKNLLHHLEQ